MTKLELILTFVFIWGTIIFMVNVHYKIKTIQKKFIQLVDIVKKHIPEKDKKEITNLMDVDFPDWFNPDVEDWEIDTLGNIIIVKQGYLPYKYDESTKTWKALSEMPELMNLISKH